MSQQPGSVTTETSADRGRWVALIVLCTGMLMIVLDQTIVNVALPAIQHDLGFSQSSLAWVINAYLIPFGGLLLLAGRLGDLAGRKRVFLAGLVVFTGASVLCGLSVSQPMLVIARFIQGAGGALASAVVLGMIVTMFPNKREQSRAIGVFSFVASAGASIGLLGGGVLTQAINWHWIFFVNVPIGIATAVLAIRLVGSDLGIGWRAGADVFGAVLVTAGLMLGVYTIIEVPLFGWVSWHTLGLGAVTALLVGGFLLRQSRTANPLLPLRVFRSRTVSGANLVVVFTLAGFFGVFFLGALYLERVLGYNALQIGLAFLPVALVIGTISLGIAERINTRFGERRVLLTSFLLILPGLALFARIPVDGDYLTDLFPAMTLIGLGAGFMFPAVMTLAMSAARADDAGLASGLINTSVQVGGAVGLALLATLSTARSTTLRLAGQPEAAALTGGFHLAFWISFGLVLAALCLTIGLLRQPSADRVAHPDDATSPAEEPTGA